MSLNMCIASDLWKLIEDEGEANKGYTEFLAKYGDSITPKFTEMITEIISEESKHILMLMEIAESLTGIKPEEY